MKQKAATSPCHNLLEPYHGYLWALAHAELGRQLRRQLDASDIVQQIADETGRTVPAVAGLLRRGLAKLREILDSPA